MRTAADLDGAFAALTAQADAYTAARDETSARPATEIDLVPRPARRRPAPIAVGAALLAAAAVVTLAVGIGRWTGDGDGSAPVGGTPAHREGPAPRTYRVTLDPKLGLRLLEVNSASDVAGFDLYSRGTHAQVTLFPASAHQRLTPGLERIELSGGRTAYYGDGTRPVLVEPAGDPSTQGPVPTPTPPETRYGKAVAWPFTRGAFLVVVFQGSIPAKSQLVRVASGLRVATTPRPIPSAFTLRSAPPGMRLVYLDSELHQAGDSAPFDLAGKDWFTNVEYRPADGAEGVAIQATSVDVTSVPRKGARPITVDGHPGYWYQKNRELDLDLGQGRYAVIAGAVDGAAIPTRTTRADLIAVAKTITVTAHPRQPALWFPATRALP